MFISFLLKFILVNTTTNSHLLLSPENSSLSLLFRGFSQLAFARGLAGFFFWVNGCNMTSFLAKQQLLLMVDHLIPTRCRCYHTISRLK
ncbi:hypothetical protein Y032_0218g2417 [Ancylostoma ceylanicum]|uniref:Uncharacterized protein n=1 Tax=Ancylostoma ceylanicum TaxID=53326 RepID=A0A016SJU9_9BILA|nr:hypothetical protein Y032_0218g2417 [Ancylostoma ceylanicum]